jgi:hypothetical protein
MGEAPMSWTTAGWKGFLVVLYFVVTTAWLPDFVLGLGAVADSSRALRDLIVLIVWGLALGAGMYMLRRAQRQGII